MGKIEKIEMMTSAILTNTIQTGTFERWLQLFQ